jgi:hypothetical protein
MVNFEPRTVARSALSYFVLLGYLIDATDPKL